MLCHSKEKPISLFLFPHQDDEYGAFHQITLAVQSDKQVICVYATDGGRKSDKRNKESLAVLTSLGVQPINIYFKGNFLGIKDGELYKNFDKVTSLLIPWLDSGSSLDSIYIPAWEGGHPDHDALHAIVVILTSYRGIADRVSQFSLYNKYRCIGPFYNVLRPLPAAGPIKKRPIPYRQRATYLRYCLSYPSQYRTWVGLFPFVFLHYLLCGAQELQPVSLERINHPPHEGLLYYEYRKFCTWNDISEQIKRYQSLQHY